MGKRTGDSRSIFPMKKLSRGQMHQHKPMNHLPAERALSKRLWQSYEPRAWMGVGELMEELLRVEKY